MISNRENDSVQNSHLRKDVENAHMDYLQSSASEQSKAIMHRKPYDIGGKDSGIYAKNHSEV